MYFVLKYLNVVRLILNFVYKKNKKPTRRREERARHTHSPMVVTYDSN